MAGRCATVLLFVGLVGDGLRCSTPRKDSFNLILQVGAGTGLLYLLRWFWWRITAWCEIVAMISSFGVALVFLILSKNGVVVRLLRSSCSSASRSPPSAGSPRPTSARRPTRRCCSSSTKRSGPSAPAGATFRRRPSVAEVEGDNIPLALLGWIDGLHHDLVGAVHRRQFPVRAHRLRADSGGIFAVSGFIVIQVVRKLWK